MFPLPRSLTFGKYILFLELCVQYVDCSINKTGEVGQTTYSKETFHLVQSPLTWPEAAVTCTATLDMYSYSTNNFNAFGILRDGLLKENMVNTSSVLWFGAFREAGSSVWNVVGSCAILDYPGTITNQLVEQTQCAAMSMTSTSLTLTARDCHDKLPFVCSDIQGGTCSYETLHGYTIDSVTAVNDGLHLVEDTRPNMVCSCDLAVACIGYTTCLHHNSHITCSEIYTTVPYPLAEAKLQVTDMFDADYSTYIKQCKRVHNSTLPLFQSYDVSCSPTVVTPTTTTTVEPSTASSTEPTTPTVTPTTPTSVEPSTTSSSEPTTSTTNNPTTPTVTPTTTTSVEPSTTSSSEPTTSTTSNPTTPTVTLTTTEPTLPGCMCYNCTSFTLDAIAKIAAQLKTITVVSAKSTSARRRTFTCADDPRYSSAIMGTVSILVIVTVVVLMTLPDILRLVRWLCRHHRKQISN